MSDEVGEQLTSAVGSVGDAMRAVAQKMVANDRGLADGTLGYKRMPDGSKRIVPASEADSFEPGVSGPVAGAGNNPSGVARPLLSRRPAQQQPPPHSRRVMSGRPTIKLGADDTDPTPPHGTPRP